jgi:hypothetical protein
MLTKRSATKRAKKPWGVDTGGDTGLAEEHFYGNYLLDAGRAADSGVTCRSEVKIERDNPAPSFSLCLEAILI